MRAVKLNSEENWHPLTSKYVHGDDIDFNNKTTTSQEGISLNISNISSKIVDSTHNNYTATQLTTRTMLNDLLTPKLINAEYPVQFTTHLLCRGFPNIGSDSRYLKIKPVLSDQSTRQYIAGNDEEDPGQSSWYITQDVDDNYIYFNITLHNANELSISHNDNLNTVFLTYHPNGDVYFETSPEDQPGRFQKFRYYIERENGVFVLTTKINDEYKYLSLNASGELQFIDSPQGVITFPPSSIFRFVKYTKSSTNLKLDNNWISYSSTGGLNTLDVNKGKSYKSVLNNYLLTTQYSQITGDDLPVDITPLKNQLTSNYNQSRHYPFLDARSCDMREYDKIFTGTNQIKGLNDMFLGYNDYTVDINLEPDKITYFHTPQDMYPYDKININDSGLVDSGATGGDTPIVSDKIFKKAADYKYSSPNGAPTDEETGIWLCSWLKNNIGSDWDSTVNYNKDIIINYQDKTYIALVPNTDVIPGTDKTTWEETSNRSMWVDRYYNPNEYTATEALKVENQYNTYSSKYDFIVSTLSAEKHYVFDKVSDLVFEPGCRYAYYKIGDKENESIINTVKSDLVHDGVVPTYNSDREEILIVEDNVDFSSDDIYIQTNTRSVIKDSSFTVSFWMHMDDWSQPIGSQIVGNYTNNGFGVFNKENVTPYISIPTSAGQYLYNTDMQKVLTEAIPVSGVSTSLGMNENIHILTQDHEKWMIKQYDKKNLLVESTSLSGVIDAVGDNMTDFLAINDSLFLLDDNCSVYEINIDNEYQNLLTNNRPVPVEPITQPTVTYPPRLGLYGDKLKPVYANTFSIDMSGNTWYLSDGVVYKNIAENQLGISASFDDYINNSRVVIVAEEKIQGNDGNEIKVTGNGTSTIATLITNWNSSHSANRAQIVMGKNIVPDSGTVIQLTGGRSAAGSTTIRAVECQQGHVVDLITDYHDNVMILCADSPWQTDLLVDADNIKIFKLDNNRNVLIGKKLTDIDSTLVMNSGEFYIDMISEFNDGSYDNHVIILHHTPGADEIDIIRLDEELNLVRHSTVNTPELSNVNLTTLRDITSFESNKHRNIASVNTNTLNFKLRLRNYFDSDKTNVSNVKQNINDLTPGYHHFTYSFDSTTSNISLYIDGDLVNIDTSDDANQAAAYKFTETINTPLIIGAAPFFNNVLLTEHLKRSSSFYTIRSKIKDVKVYNDSLNYFKVQALTKQHHEIQPAVLTLPSGGRTFLDQITKFYKHRQPGNKSNHFNINIISPPALSSQDLKDEIEARLTQELQSHIPVNSNINNINWT